MVFTVCEGEIGIRLDKLLVGYTGLTRSSLVRLFEDGLVTVNGKPAKKNAKVSAGDLVSVTVPEPKSTDVKAEEIPLCVVYEDEHLLVVNKPRGIVVHPAAGHYEGTLVNALLAHCGDSLSGINGVIRPGIVHRIDKDTSGLLVVAKTNEAHLKLTEMFKKHDFLRVYNGLVYGHLREKEGTVDKPIGRDPKDRKKMAVTSSHSRNAVTHYRVLAEFDTYSLCEFRLETGRTHQIRVHMASLGHALVGDPLYSPKSVRKDKLTGQLLHAKQIGFVHPVTGQYLSFDSDLPDYFLPWLTEK